MRKESLWSSSNCILVFHSRPW